MPDFDVLQRFFLQKGRPTFAACLDPKNPPPHLCRYNRDTSFYKKGTRVGSVGFLFEGYVKVANSENGREKIISFIRPGEFMGCLLSHDKDNCYPHDLIALTPLVVLQIPVTVFESVWKKNPDILLLVQNCVMSRIQTLQKWKGRDHLSPQRKLALFVLENFMSSDSFFFQKALQRKDLASFLSMKVETLVRSIQTLEQRGLLQRKSRLLEVPCPEKLQNFALLDERRDDSSVLNARPVDHD